MNRAKLKRGLTAGLLALILGTALSAGARTIVDPRAGAVGAFFQCVRGAKCPVDQYFVGAETKQEIRKARESMRKRNMRVKSYGMVTNVPKRFRAKWNTRWGSKVVELGKAGYDAKALGKLGTGRSMVYARPRVALALVKLTVEKASGRTRDGYLILVLWKIKHRWYVAYVEDSPGKVARFMTGHRPP